MLSMLVVVRVLSRPQPMAARLRWWSGVAGLVLLAYLLTRAPLPEVGAALRSMGWAWLGAIPIALAWTAAHTLHAAPAGGAGQLAGAVRQQADR